MPTIVSATVGQQRLHVANQLAQDLWRMPWPKHNLDCAHAEQTRAQLGVLEASLLQTKAPVDADSREVRAHPGAGLGWRPALSRRC
jgi:ABC-type sugar transport system ATPase subunit